VIYIAGTKKLHCPKSRVAITKESIKVLGNMLEMFDGVNKEGRKVEAKEIKADIESFLRAMLR